MSNIKTGSSTERKTRGGDHWQNNSRRFPTTEGWEFPDCRTWQEPGTRHPSGKLQRVSGDKEYYKLPKKGKTWHPKDQKLEWLRTSRQQDQKLENNEEYPQTSENSVIAVSHSSSHMRIKYRFRRARFLKITSCTSFLFKLMKYILHQEWAGHGIYASDGRSSPGEAEGALRRAL